MQQTTYREAREFRRRWARLCLNSEMKALREPDLAEGSLGGRASPLAQSGRPRELAGSEHTSLPRGRAALGLAGCRLCQERWPKKEGPGALWMQVPPCLLPLQTPTEEWAPHEACDA